MVWPGGNGWTGPMGHGWCCPARPRQNCSRVIVMYAGRIVEEATVASLFADPQHPYTLGLLGSIPRLGSDGDEALTAIEGVVPNPFALPAGCRFSPRCPLAKDRCHTEQPTLQEIAPGHRVACFRAPIDQVLLA